MGEIAVSLAVNFDMDVDPAGLAVLEGDLDEGVGKAFAQRVQELTPRCWKQLFAANPLRSPLRCLGT